METRETVESKENYLPIVETMYSQLGGGVFKIMTGAKDFRYQKNMMSFRLPKALKSINSVSLELNADDTYTMTFYKVRWSSKSWNYVFTEIDKKSGIYADQLRSIFESVTGLRTSLK